MNELLPIIRRKRRPLLPVEALPDVPPVTVPAVESLHDLPLAPAPVEVSDVKLVEIVVTDDKPKPSDDEAA